MIKGFWKKIEKPIIGLSPMDGVTDAAMRFITAKYGHPSVIFTEFINVEGLVRKPDKFLPGMKYDEIERPIVAQLFGNDPQAFGEAAAMVAEMNFDGIDINMGCPSKSVTDNGSGAGLIENRALAEKIVGAVRVGAANLPVSVKTRIGTAGPDESWWKFLSEMDLAAVTLHGRSFKQMYQGRADWETIARAASLIKRSGALVLGNGDIESRKDAVDHIEKYGVDGVLIGRAAMGNPWVFRDQEPKNREERLAMALEHAKKYEELFPGGSFLPMRKHLAWYAKGFDDAAELRFRLVQTNSVEEVEKILGGVFD